jgi:hypothetical protein
VLPKTLVPVALSAIKVAGFESVEVRRVIVDGGAEADGARTFFCQLYLLKG